MSIVIQYEPDFYVNFSMHKEALSKSAEQNRPKNPQVKRSAVIDFEGLRNENKKIIESLESSLQIFENIIDEIQRKNEMLLTPEKSKNFELVRQERKALGHCEKLQIALVDMVTNLKPECIDDYRKIKKDYEDCEKKLKLL